jgi:hypothetical protein
MLTGRYEKSIETKLFQYIHHTFEVACDGNQHEDKPKDQGDGGV